MPIDDAAALSAAAHDAAERGQVVYLTGPDGRRLAAIVPADIAAEIEAAEDAADIAAAEEAMAEPGGNIPAAAVWAELGLTDDDS